METENRQPQRKTKRGAAGKQDLRLLVAAASVAVTLGGAGLLVVREPAALSVQPDATATPATQAAAATQATEQVPNFAAAPTNIPNPTATGSSMVPAATAVPAAMPVPVDLPAVTIPQRQWPGAMTNSRSSR
jgi:hypothetical protein